MKLIKLTKDKFVAVDDADYVVQNIHMWHYLKTKSGNEYAIRADNTDPKNRQKSIYLHREIMNAPDELDVDHKDGDGLNCQRYNLRICTRSENSMNKCKTNKETSSKYKGVCWHRDNSKWVVKIMSNNKLLHLGSFKTQEEAARVYDRSAIKLFGEFAKTNFPLEDYQNDND